MSTLEFTSTQPISTEQDQIRLASIRTGVLLAAFGPEAHESLIYAPNETVEAMVATLHPEGLSNIFPYEDDSTGRSRASAVQDTLIRNIAKLPEAERESVILGQLGSLAGGRFDKQVSRKADLAVDKIAGYNYARSRELLTSLCGRAIERTAADDE